MASLHLDGIVASQGYAIAQALVIQQLLDIPHATEVDVEFELARLRNAVNATLLDLEKIQKQVEQEIGEDQSAILGAQIMMLKDPALIDAIVSKIETERVNAEYAIDQVAAQWVAIFEAMEDPYMRERAADIRDISQRLIRQLLRVSATTLSQLVDDVIVIAHDLTPSETAQMDKLHVKGFATNIGGRTSHSAIMARSLQIPAVVGLQTITEHVASGDVIVVDGVMGKVILHPTAEEIAEYEELMLQFQQERDLLGQWAAKSTVTHDGQHIELAVNIGGPDDVEQALQFGAEGIGLYRTEFLFLGRHQLPTEEEQFEAYRAVAVAMQGKPVIIRTLDIGGDKELPYLNLPKEMNPFLGVRAIRLCLLEQQELFKTQLRAILRASSFGDVRMMYPMISTLSELRLANELLAEAKRELTEQGLSYREDLLVGIMIEVPAAAIAADILAPEVDFFSIGTNDLIQYTFASDRMNEQLVYLYQPYHPAILRLIHTVITAAKKAGKWVGMCGEMAGDSIAVPILVGMGIDELSMSATSILSNRRMLAQFKMDELRNLVEHVMQRTSQDEVRELVESFIANQNR